MGDESITLLLEAAKTGDAAATHELFSAIYAELKRLAASHRRRWRGNETINTTALIHEAFIKLAQPVEAGYANRTHFYATASQAMRQILVNYAERQHAAKRGGDAVRVTLDDIALKTEASADQLLDLHESLIRLEANSPRRCRIVECRVFGGMTVAETAEALSVSVSTVKREWQVATARLYQDMQDV